MSRVQLALRVSDLEASVAFYRAVRGGAAKRRPGYANFAIAEPPLKLVLIEGEPRPGAPCSEPPRRRGRHHRRGRPRRPRGCAGRAWRPSRRTTPPAATRCRTRCGCTAPARSRGRSTRSRPTTRERWPRRPRSAARCDDDGSACCTPAGDSRRGVVRADKPTVLFVCVHNAGRSQMAAALPGAPRRRPRRGAVRRVARPPTGQPRRRRGDGRGGHRHLGRGAQGAHRRGRPGVRRRDHDGLRRRLPVLPRQALRGLGARRPGRPGRRRGAADPRRDPRPHRGAHRRDRAGGAAGDERSARSTRRGRGARRGSRCSTGSCPCGSCWPWPAGLVLGRLAARGAGRARRGEGRPDVAADRPRACC